MVTTDSATNGTVASDLLTGLFTAVLQFRSASPADPVVDALDQGAYIGSGDGAVEGNEVRGTVSWSLYAGDCLYPLIRAGQSVTEDLHLSTLNPGGFVDTHDGVRVRFDGRGYGLRSPERYVVSATLTFRTQEVSYHWLTKVLAVMHGEFDEKSGRAVWNVLVPKAALP